MVSAPNANGPAGDTPICQACLTTARGDNREHGCDRVPAVAVDRQARPMIRRARPPGHRTAFRNGPPAHARSIARLDALYVPIGPRRAVYVHCPSCPEHAVTSERVTSAHAAVRSALLGTLARYELARVRARAALVRSHVLTGADLARALKSIDTVHARERAALTCALTRNELLDSAFLQQPDTTQLLGEVS